MYNNIYKLIIYILLINFFYSCKNEMPASAEDLFVKVNDFNIVRDENIEENLFTYYMETDSSDFIVTFSQNNNIIFIYDFETAELLDRIEIPVKGRISSIYFENVNSIYFFPEKLFSIYKLLDRTRAECAFCLTQEEFKYVMRNFDMGMYNEFEPTLQAPVYIEDSTFYIAGSISPLNPLQFQKPFYIITITDSSFNVNTKIGNFPEKMIGNNGLTIYPFDNNIAFTRNDKKNNIFSFSPDDTLYIYNDTSLISKVNCRSRFKTNEIPFISIKDMNNEDIIYKRIITYDSYWGIYYDKYNDIYYRVFRIGEKKYKQDGLYNTNDYKYSIMVLDNEFNIIEEQLFNAGEYFFNYIIVTKEGILLKKPDDFSGETKYSLFKINKKYLNKSESNV